MMARDGTTIGEGLFLCLVSMSLAASTGGGVKAYRLHVLHTNDMHSHFDQIDRVGAQCPDVVAEGHECYGGFARIKMAVAQARDQAATADNAADGTLFLNAGDTFQGTPFYSYFKWKVVARMLQMLDIDVMSLGNHEFDDGVKDLKLFLEDITIPVVASNLDLSDEPSLANVKNLMKSKVLMVGGRKIGIIGYLLPDTKNISRTEKVKILPEIPSIAAEAKRLKNEGVNILIALGHSGFEMDIQIAKQVQDIDLVVGGHTDTFLYTGIPPDIENPVGPYPFLVEQPKTKRIVPVVQASYQTKYLGELWLEFDEAGEIITSYGNPILLNSHIGQDPEVASEVKRFEKKILTETNEVIGSSSVFIEGINEYCRARECNLGNFVTDSFIDYNLRNNIKSFDLKKYWTDVPIAVIQAGGIRANINHLSRGGNITYGDLLSAMPFENDIGKITTKGSDIWNAFELAFRRYRTDMFHGEFLQVSGLNVVIDLGQPSGKRVKSIQARCGNCVVPVYEKLDLNANYTIIISKYLSDGGDGIKLEKVVDYQSFGISEIEILKSEIRIKSPIRPEVGHRIILLNREKLESRTSGQHVSASISIMTLLLMIMISLTNGF